MKKRYFGLAVASVALIAGCSSSGSAPPPSEPAVPVEPNPTFSVAPENVPFCDTIVEVMMASQVNGQVDDAQVQGVVELAPPDVAPLLPDYFSRYAEFLDTGDATLAESPEVVQAADAIVSVCG